MPTRRGKSLLEGNKASEEKRRLITWAQRLKRVFNIDVEICDHCGGSVKVIAGIEDQPVIDKILAHLLKKGELPTTADTLPEITPPTSQLVLLTTFGLFDDLWCCHQ